MRMDIDYEGALELRNLLRVAMTETQRYMGRYDEDYWHDDCCPTHAKRKEEVALERDALRDRLERQRRLYGLMVSASGG